MYEFDVTKVFPKNTVSISLTAGECALACKHCNKKYLCHMLPISAVVRAGLSALPKNATSVLISGGCDSSGVVPLIKHAPHIRELKKKFRVIAHTGIGSIPDSDIKKIASLVDVISFNLIGATSTIKNIYGVSQPTADMLMENFLKLSRAVRVVPHITVGLDACKIVGEYKAIDFLADQGFREIVINVLIPTKGTEFALLAPVCQDDVVQLLAYARERINSVTLGCMRPRGKYRTTLDKRVLEFVDKIVNPSINFVSTKSPHLECCVL